MAHELSIINGVAEMAYLQSEGECWHNLGQPVPDNAERTEWQRACNIDSWEVLRCRSTFLDPSGTIHRVPGQVQLVRSDNYGHLGTVSEMFRVHQPKEVNDWMFDLVDQLGFEMSTMGVLFNGKKFWCQANIKQSVNIGGVDRVDGKLLISVPNTGKDATTIHYTTVRVVCNNTLRMATGGDKALKDGILRINHMNEFNADKVNEALGLPVLSKWAALADRMAKAKIKDDDAQDFFLRVFDLKEEVEDDMSADEIEAANIKQLENKAVKTCFELFKGAGKGAELKTSQGTVWGALNAATEYIDHHRNTRTWDRSFDQSQFGKWANIKADAFDTALSYI